MNTRNFYLHAKTEPFYFYTLAVFLLLPQPHVFFALFRCGLGEDVFSTLFCFFIYIGPPSLKSHSASRCTMDSIILAAPATASINTNISLPVGQTYNNPKSIAAAQIPVHQ